MRTWIFACFAVLVTTASAAAANVDLSIAMTDSPDPVTAGQTVSYVINVTDATATANNVSMVDTLPNGALFVAANGTNWTCVATPAAAPTTVTCTRPTAAVGAQQPITIVVQSPVSNPAIPLNMVGAGLNFTMTNTAKVSTTDTDTNMANNTTTATTSVKTSADLSISQSTSATVAAASTVTWDVSVDDLGPSPAAMVTVTDTLPATVTNIAAVGAAGATSVWTCTVAGQVATCTADPLVLGSNEHITITATTPNEPQTLTNLVAVSSTTADPQSNNNSKSLDTNVVAGADLSIALAQDMDAILVSGTVMFTITVTNHGPSTAQAVSMVNTLPTNDVFVSASGTGWTCTNATNVVTCDASSLPVGDAPVITIVATGPGTPQKVIDTATVTSTTADPTTTNNSAMIETSILGSADVSISTTAVDKALTSSTLTFTIDIHNDGPSDAQSVRVIDTLPDGTTFVKFDGLHWGCKDVDQTLTCDTTSIATGASAPTITITVTAPDSGDTLMNLVTVSSSTHDPDADNNTAMAVTTLQGVGIRGGSGCNAGGGGSGVVLLLGVAALLRRRRRAALVGAALIAGAPVASAQVANSKENFPIDQMRLALDNDGILAVELGSVLKPGEWSAATFVGYQTNPLVAYNTATGQTIGALVKKRITGQVAVGVGITRWFEAGLELPIIYNQTRDDMAVPGVTSALKSPRMGALRLDPKFLLLRGGEGKVGIAAIAGIGIPTGGSEGYAGDDGITFTPEVDVGFMKKGFRVALDGGLVVRSSTDVGGIKVDDQIFVRLGAAYRLPVGLELAAQLLSATSVSHVWSQKDTDPTEADIGLTFATEGFSVFALGGRGLQTGVGAPDWRFFAGIRISPAADNRPPDRDGDGIPDAQDKCPNEPEDKDGFQDEDGCPDKDNDGDGIADEDDRCPNDPEDKDGFQDTDGCPDPDNDQDGIPDVKDKCPNEPEDKDGFQDEDGCPDPDNDNDGVPDVEDKCPGEPGPKETHGCPDPDSDGDGIVDRLDTCPDEKGTDANGGCAKKPLAILRADRIEATVALKGEALAPTAGPTLDAVVRIIQQHQLIKVRVDGRGAVAIVKYLTGKAIADSRLQANPGPGGAPSFVLVDKIEAPKPEDQPKPDEPKKPDEPEIEMEP